MSFSNNYGQRQEQALQTNNSQVYEAVSLLLFGAILLAGVAVLLLAVGALVWFVLVGAGQFLSLTIGWQAITLSGVLFIVTWSGSAWRRRVAHRRAEARLIGRQKYHHYYP